MSNSPSSGRSKAETAASSDPKDIGPMAEQVEDLVASDTNASLFLEVLDKTLRPDISETTFEEITRAGGEVMGKDALTLVISAATTDDGMRILEPELSPKAMDYVRRIAVLHGGRLRQALHASDVPASRGNDWQSFNADSYLDLEAKRFILDLEIEKFNGERIEIRSSLQSTLILAENILLAAMSIEDMSQISSEHRERIKKLVDELCARLEVGNGDPKVAEGTTEEPS